MNHDTNDAPRDRELIDEARRELESLARGVKKGTIDLGSAKRSGSRPSLPPADSFTGYEILREIHRGGQGVVYQALQRSTQRKVAIKVLKEGPFAGVDDRARFEREVKVLGRLNHPNIVAIHDTGEAAGHVYFVMDYISGQPLDVYMASGERGIHETLELCAKICEAVSSAHLRGVIHRDLKPSNIRVDASGEPHVLDFGLAKVATGPDMAMTMTGQFIGSLPWASPEQAEGAPDKIDLRTDVYSLGVVLYQMLTAKFPYEVVGNMGDVLDRIRRAVPTRPRDVRPQIDDEAETIVLKCLAKDRDRRYQTAGELGRDIRAYLRGDPIAAKRDSMGYLLRKQMRRYRVPATIAALFVIVVTIGFGVSLSALRDAHFARDEASEALKNEKAALASEKEQRSRAETEGANARAIASFYREIFESGNPYRATPLVRPGSGIDYPSAASDISVADVLLASRSRIAERFRDQPHLEAEVRDAVGSALAGIGYWPEGKAELREALDAHERAGAGHSVAAHRTRTALAFVLCVQGRCREALDLVEKATEGLTRLLGPEERETLRARGVRAASLCAVGRISEGLALAREVKETSESIYSPSDIGYSFALMVIASCYSKAGLPDETEDAARKLLASVEARGWTRDPLLGAGPGWLAAALVQRGRHAEAEVAYRRHYEIAREVAGVHLMAGLALDRVVDQMGRQGKREEQIDYCEEAIRVCREHHGDEGFPTLKWQLRRAEILVWLDRLPEAEAIARETVSIFERQLSKGQRISYNKPRDLLAEHRALLTHGHRVLSKICKAQGKTSEALTLLERRLEVVENALGHDAEDTIDARRDLARAYAGEKRFDDARALSKRIIESWERRALRPDARAWELNALARELISLAPPPLRDAKRAVVVADRAAELSRRKDPAILDTLGVALFESGDRERSVEVEREALSLLPLCDAPIRRTIVQRLAGFLFMLEKDDGARRLIENEVKGLRSLFQTDDPGFTRSLYGLAGVLVANEEYARAQSLCAESVDILRIFAAPVHRRSLRAWLKRQARCLEQLGRVEEANRCRAEMEQLNP